MSDILGERDDAIPERPTRVAEPSRTQQLPKRFYQDVAISDDAPHTILLDGRSIKTPGKKELAFTNPQFAEAIAQEWRDQQERIDPMTMPLTRLANTAFDGVANDMQAVKEDIVRYAGTDLICYRAGHPENLVAAQNQHWDPLIDFAQSSLNCRFELAQGVMHIQQPAESIAGFSTHVGLIDDPFVLSAAHMITSLTGSATIALAVLKGVLNADEAWTSAHVDEDWNIQEWGEDEEAKTLRTSKFRDMKAAVTTIEILG